MASETKQMPDCYAEAHIARYVELGKVRRSISAECAKAIAAENDACVQATEADDCVRGAQHLLLRAQEFTKARACHYFPFERCEGQRLSRKEHVGRHAKALG
jgi:hypothetical protein